MLTGQNCGTPISATGNALLRARDGGILGFYVNGGTQGVIGFYDVATSASAASAGAAQTIIASATCQLGWNWIQATFVNGCYLSNTNSLPVTSIFCD